MERIQEWDSRESRFTEALTDTVWASQKAESWGNMEWLQFLLLLLLNASSE